MIAIRWLTAVIDLAPQEYDRGLAIWSRLTGYRVSRGSGRSGELVTLLPAEGEPFLKVQRLDAGPSRTHLHLHVEDLADSISFARAVGAEVTAEREDSATLRSPGGLTYCHVSDGAGRRPRPTTWAGGHSSFVDQVCLDVPPRLLDAEMDFWHTITGWSRRDPGPGSEFARLTPPPDLPLQLLVQRLDDDEEESARAHLDWASTDRRREVDRQIGAGADLVAPFDRWTVMRGPEGFAYCITQRPAILEQPEEEGHGDHARR